MGFILARQLVLVVSNIFWELEGLHAQSYASCQPQVASSKEFWEVSWGQDLGPWSLKAGWPLLCRTVSGKWPLLSGLLIFPAKLLQNWKGYLLTLWVLSPYGAT